MHFPEVLSLCVPDNELGYTRSVTRGLDQSTSMAVLIVLDQRMHTLNSSSQGCYTDESGNRGITRPSLANAAGGHSAFSLWDGWEGPQEKARCWRVAVCICVWHGSCLSRVCSHLQCLMEQAQLFLLNKGGRENGFSEITEELAVLPSLPSSGFTSKRPLLGTLQGQGLQQEMDKTPEGKEKTFRIFGLGYL